MPFQRVKLSDVAPHELGDLIHEDPEVACGPSAENDASPHPWVVILYQDNRLGMPVVPLTRVGGGCILWPGGRPMDAVGVTRMPNVRPPSERLHADGLDVPTVRAEVAPAVLQLLQAVYAVGAPGRRDGPHPERQRHPLGEVVQEGVEALEPAPVNGHSHAAELGIAALEEGDPLGWVGCCHVGGVNDR